jgi:hypothetical protein
VLAPFAPVVLLVALAGAETTASSQQPKRPLLHNAITLAPIAIPKSFGLSLGYERAVHRHVSLGARIDYPFARRSSSYIQGVGETIALQAWATQAFHGFYGEASLGVTHHLLVRAPQLSRTAIAPGLGIGLRWMFRHGLLLGASVGLRWAREVAGSPAICTHAEVCPLVREGVQVRLGIELGWAFGRGPRHPRESTREGS